MDLEEYWQENKPFVTRVGVGALAFLIGLGFVSRGVGADLEDERRLLVTKQRELDALRRDGFSADSLEEAEIDHEQLLAAAESLRERVAFRPRGDFAEAAQRATPASYLGAVTAVRERVFPRAGRRNVEIDPTLGLPEISPTRPEELERTLEGLDALEQVLDLAIEEGVDEVDKLRIRIDPDLFGRRGVGVLERTRVELRLRGDNGPVLRTLARTQTDLAQPLLIEKLEASASRERPDQVRLECTLVVARVADELGAVEEG